MKTLSLSWQNPVRISCQLCQQTSVPWAFLHLSGISSDPRCHWTLLGLVSGISTYRADGFLLCLWLNTVCDFPQGTDDRKKSITKQQEGMCFRSLCYSETVAAARRRWAGTLHRGKKKKKKTHGLLTHPSPFQVQKEKKRGNGSKVGRTSRPLCQCPIAIQPKFEHQFPSLRTVFKEIVVWELWTYIIPASPPPSWGSCLFLYLGDHFSFHICQKSTTLSWYKMTVLTFNGCLGCDRSHQYGICFVNKLHRH